MSRTYVEHENVLVDFSITLAHCVDDAPTSKFNSTDETDARGGTVTSPVDVSLIASLDFAICPTSTEMRFIIADSTMRSSPGREFDRSDTLQGRLRLSPARGYPWLGSGGVHRGCSRFGF